MTGRLFTPPPLMSERQWQSTIEDGLTRCGYYWNHQYRAKLHDGTWRTTASGRPPNGYPDLMAYRHDAVLGIETKKDRRAKPTPTQIEWLIRVADTPAGHAWVLRPQDDWHEIAAWIQRPTTAPRIYGFDPSN